jgi:Mg-chelatase subunit ChlD
MQTNVIVGSKVLFLLFIAPALLLAFSVPVAAQQTSASQSNVELIIDASGSMAQKIGGRSKMEIAKQALTELLFSLPPTTNVAVRAYGHRSKKDCADIELLANFGEQRITIPAKVNTLKPLGMTPLASSIAEAANDFSGREGQDNSVILITDGIETCEGDPCGAAAGAHQAGVKVKINVIGFKIDPKERVQLECIAREGGGKYVSANDAKELTAATQQVAAPLISNPPPAPAATGVPVVATPTPPPPPPPDILAQSAGGQVVVAPNDLWTQTNDGKEDVIKGSGDRYIKVGQEVVYAFKDEQPATFDEFATLVPTTDNENLKDFELLVSDDSPTGNFRSIGRFTVQNAKLMKSPYQEFKFEPVTAKYLKLKALSNYGASFNDLTLYEFKVFGKTNAQSSAGANSPALTEERIGPTSGASTATPEAKSEGTNILAQSAGGHVLAPPNNLWTQTNDGKEDVIKGSADVYIKVGQEAVYAFKDEQPATFDKFATLVPSTDNENLKDFELLVSDDSPTGAFRSIGTFTVQNAKMMKGGGYQEFKFEPVTAKYLKFKAISNYGASFHDLSLYEFKVFSSVAK